jgi:hypothetical protein
MIEKDTPGEGMGPTKDAKRMHTKLRTMSYLSIEVGP